MGMLRSEKRKIDKATEVSSDDIEELLEDYPGAAIQLSVKNDCLPDILNRFVEIVNKSREMRDVIDSILTRIDRESKEDRGEYKINSTHILYKEMAEAIGDERRKKKWERERGSENS